MNDTSQDITRGFRRQGALIMALFALVWAAAGNLGLAGTSTVSTAVLVAALVVTAAAVVLALRVGPTPPGTPPRELPADWLRRFNLVGLLQAVAIGLVVALFVTTGLPALIPAAVCLVVGVHFFPLAPTFDQPQYRWTGAALCAVAVAGLGVFAALDGEASRAVVGLGAALVLWVTSFYIALRG